MFKHHTVNQMILPLDLEIKLDGNDFAYVVNKLVEQIPNEAFEGFKRSTGCPAYHPRMMMKVILCAYTQSVFFGRKIEGLINDSFRMACLAQGHQRTYSTINRFRVHPEVKEILRKCFIEFRCQLVQTKQIDEETIFIDGTKVEANTNKFTFVWRKSIERYSTSLITKSNEMYDELLTQEIIPEIKRVSSDELSVEELKEMMMNLDGKIKDYNKTIEASDVVIERKELRSARKKPKQDRKLLNDYIVRKKSICKI